MVQVQHKTLGRKQGKKIRELEGRATERAESEVRFNRPSARSAAENIEEWLCTSRRGEEEGAIGAVHERLFSGPPPYGHEEEFEDLFVVHQIGSRPAVHTFSGTALQYLPDLLF